MTAVLQPILTKLSTLDEIVEFVQDCDRQNMHFLGIGILKTLLQQAPTGIHGEAFAMITNAIGHFFCCSKRYDDGVRTFLDSVRVCPSQVAEYNLFQRVSFIEDEAMMLYTTYSLIELAPTLSTADRILFAMAEKLNEHKLYEHIPACLAAMKNRPMANLLLGTLMVPSIYTDEQSVVAELTRFEDTLTEALKPSNLRVIKRFFDDNKDLLLPKVGYYLIYTGNNTLKAHTLLRQLYSELFPFLFFKAKFAKTTSASGKKRRPRIGVVSTHMFNSKVNHHSVDKVLGQVVENIDDSQFEVVVFAFSTVEAIPNFMSLAPGRKGVVLQAISKEPFRTTMDRWHSIVENEDLDILFYPDIGMDPYTYFLSFSHLARSQVTTWGHPDCHGTSMDYYITSSFFNNNPALHMEKLITLEDKTFLFRKPTELCERIGEVKRADFNLPENARIYMCLQSIFKITPLFETVINGILERDPEGYVVVINTAKERTAFYKENLRKRCKHPHLIILDQKVSSSDFVAFASLANILIDTFPFSGGISSLECLAAGLPIITMEQPHIRGSQTTAYYRIMGIDEAIAKDTDEYIEKAFALASSKERYDALKSRILLSNDILYTSDHATTQHTIDAWNNAFQEIACK